MPELPEVETTRRGIAPYLTGATISKVIVRDHRLRWPVNKRACTQLSGRLIQTVERRGKYLLIITEQASVIVHLGMSGHLSVVPIPTAAAKHDHIDLQLQSGMVLRFTDPRRFGCFIVCKRNPYQHRLLKDLGPEPLSSDFDADYLFSRSRSSRLPIKTFIMDSKVVVGVGNIYASESLFSAGIQPKRRCNNLSRPRYQTLVAAIKDVLQQAVQQGGTTLRDFAQSDGRPGYFRHQLKVYGREGEACVNCGRPIRLIRLAQRSTFYCGHCQR